MEDTKVKIIEDNDVDFSEFEKKAAKEIKNSQTLNIKRFSLKRFIATVLVTAMTNFFTKRSYQLGLCIYLVLTVPAGTKWLFVSIYDFIFNEIEKWIKIFEIVF